MSRHRFDIELIDEFMHPMKVKETIEGRKMMEERDILMKQMKILANVNGLTFSQEKDS